MTDINNPRTLSGVNAGTINQIRLPSTEDAILIDGDEGLPNQGIFKNGITGKLEWDYAETTSIPDNSITGAKLKDDITIVTSGNIDANNGAFTSLRSSTLTLPKSGAGETIIDSDGINMIGTRNITIDNGNFDTSNGNVIIRNGGDLNMFSDLNATLKFNVDGSSGDFTSQGEGVINSLRTDTFTLPKNGVAEITMNTAGLTLTGTKKILCNDDIETNNGNMIIENGGDFIGYSDNQTTKTIDIDASTGDLKLYNPLNGSERIELDGTTGNVLINQGGRIDMFLGNNIMIELNGVNGVIDCRDINIQSHSGLLTLDRLRCDEFNCNSFTIPEDPPNQGGAKLTINNVGDITTAGDITTTAGNVDLTTGNVDLTNGSLFIDNGTAFIGNIGGGNHRITLNGANGRIDCERLNNAGDYTSTTGDITLSTGNLTLSGNTSIADFSGKVNIRGSSGLDFFKTAGGNTIRMVPETGNVLMDEGKLTLAKSGTTPAPTDATSGTYTDWAIDVNNTNGHVRVNGNIICGGTIFGAVDGAITEEIIEGQRLTLRKDPSGQTSGNTQLTMNIGAGETGFFDMNYNASSTGTNGIRIQNNNANVFDVTKSGSINNVQSIIMRGTVLNNVNSANFIMGTKNCIMVNQNTGANGTEDKLRITFGSSTGDESEILLRRSNSDRIKLDTDIRLYNSIQTETIHLVSQTGEMQCDGNLRTSGDLMFDNQTKKIIGKDGNSSTSMLSNHTECDNLYLGDQSNILYSTGSMAHSITTNFCYLDVINTPSDWVDLNPNLQISYTSKARKVNLLVRFDYYALLTAGCELYLKLWDGGQYIQNFYQPTYLSQTTQKVFDNVHGSDNESWRTTSFIIEDYPANTTTNLRVACRTIASSGHKARFYLGKKSKTSEPTSSTTDMYGGMSLYLMATDIGNVNNNTPTGWTEPSSGGDDY